MKKNIAYDINGKNKDSSKNYYDDVTNKLNVENISSSYLYLNLPDGILTSNINKQLSSSTPSTNTSLRWNGSSWVFAQTESISANIPIPAGSDISGSSLTNANVVVRNLSNVTSGILMPNRGGTGLSNPSTTGEALFLLSGASVPLVLLTASFSVADDGKVLSKNSSNDGWTLISTSSFTSSTISSIYYT